MRHGSGKSNGTTCSGLLVRERGVRARVTRQGASRRTKQSVRLPSLRYGRRHLLLKHHVSTTRTQL